MKEFVNKLIGRLEELKTEALDKWDGGASHRAYSKAIEIVNELAEEYINTSTDTSSDTLTTNADVIRSMTDEELARFLSKTVWEEGANLFDCSDYTCGYPCMECKGYLDWLQSEVKGSK